MPKSNLAAYDFTKSQAWPQTPEAWRRLLAEMYPPSEGVLEAVGGQYSRVMEARSG